MNNNTNYTNNGFDLVKDYLLTSLEDFNYDGFSIDSCDLHNEVFNTDYVTIGTYQAEEELGELAHDMFTALETYQEEFGEGYTDIGNPEKVLNLVYYMIGNEIINDINYLQDVWDQVIDHTDIQKIIKELK